MKGTKDFAGQTLDTLVFPSIPLGASCTLGVLMELLQAEGSIGNYLPELTVQQKSTGPFWKGVRGRGGGGRPQSEVDPEPWCISFSEFPTQVPFWSWLQLRVLMKLNYPGPS